MRPAHWTHDRVSFFKYASGDAARNILSTSKLRWSAPVRFNDPFDIQFDLHANYGPQTIAKTVDWFWNALHTREDLRRVHLAGVPEASIQQMLSHLDRDTFNREMGAIVREEYSGLPDLMAQSHSELRAFFRRTLVLCLSEVADNILMWSHYADMHRGVVLEFSCVPDLDSAWGVAEPVCYQPAMPTMFDEEFLISQDAELEDPKAMFRKMVYTKAVDWAYEREWRVVNVRSEVANEYEDLPFSPRELASVRLGCRMPEQERIAIAALVRDAYLETTILQAHKADRKFALRFDETP